MQNLEGPTVKGKGGADVACRVTESRHSSIVLIRQNLEVVEGATTILEASQPGFMAGLFLRRMLLIAYRGRGVLRRDA
jgi:hypothetical protein